MYSSYGIKLKETNLGASNGEESMRSVPVAGKVRDSAVVHY